jgi:hypothetical protein
MWYERVPLIVPHIELTAMCWGCFGGYLGLPKDLLALLPYAGYLALDLCRQDCALWMICGWTSWRINRPTQEDFDHLRFATLREERWRAPWYQRAAVSLQEAHSAAASTREYPETAVS